MVPRARRTRRRWLTRRGAARAAIVLTDSEFSRSEIETRLSASTPSRIAVIPPGVTRRGRGRPPAATREPLVLFVGSIFNRRRLPDLIAAFAQATPRSPDARLVIVGDDRTWPPQDLAASPPRTASATASSFARYVPDDGARAACMRAPRSSRSSPSTKGSG